MFLSHPREGDREHIILSDHLAHVAERTRELVSDTEFDAAEEAYYSGLLHDIGKLNPWYQKQFSQNVTSDELDGQYVRKHGIFSAWAAHKLLRGRVTPEQRMRISCIIAGHHTQLRNSPSGKEDSDRFRRSQDGTYENMLEFSKDIGANDGFKDLGWDQIDKFNDVVEFSRPMKAGNNHVEDYVKTSVIFSSLLQADRGAFGSFPQPRFDMDTEMRIKKDRQSVLDPLRTKFQNDALVSHDYDLPISVLEAPTGIGKTKLFLDMIGRYKKRQDFQRVYYFSPLLALTDGFKSVLDCIPNIDKDRIMEYNHVFAGTLKKDEESMQVDRWRFEIESFNEPFIITTMQRFLITLYSNMQADRLKLASFRRSLLILDEVQTIPKFLLPNMLRLLRTLCEKMHSKALLVSATIPAEFKNEDLHTTSPSGELKRSYMKCTQRNIELVQELILPEPQDITSPMLVMNNTRAKARMSHDMANEKYGDQIDTIYLSSGIRKSSRQEQIRRISESSGRPLVVVSTQVMEAGVDVSFSRMFREVAPLDSIIQAMGRLDREGNSESPAILTVFKTDGMSTPYTSLEFARSKAVIEQVVQSTGTSQELYEKLEEYYEEISSSNEANREELKRLDDSMQRMEFDEVWKIVKSNVFKRSYYPDIIVPPTDEADSIRGELLRILGTGGDRGTKKRIMKKFAKYVASLPLDPHSKDSPISEFLDEEVGKHGVLFPKIGSINELYDDKIGLDKWTKRQH